MMFKKVSIILCLISSFVYAQDISDNWRLWPDENASWQHDKLYLPDQTALHEMPVNPPTGGWEILNDTTGLAVQLPSTVEEHYWGNLSSRPYKYEYYFEAIDPDVRNGSYRGVSWWWRKVDVPKLNKNDKLIIQFRGARFRAEVYFNGRLCGYQLIPELPFEADVTDAIKSGGDNLLAVRITNPGGRLDWCDRFDWAGAKTFMWGDYELPISHGFGGMDAGIEMTVRPRCYVADIFVMNQPELRKVKLVAEVKAEKSSYKGPIELQISKDGKVLWSHKQSVKVSEDSIEKIEIEAAVPGAQVWELDSPVLYEASASLPKSKNSERKVNFGFRWFTATGIGEDAKLMLNGKRIVLRSAIAWGFWAPNGLWPSEAQATKEVEAAKALGLNCIQTHRHLSKPLILDTQDRMGLLRYEEPGAGCAAFGESLPMSAPSPKGLVDTSGAGGEPKTFTEKFEQEKILQMVKRDRSHPSLIIYCLQNEINPDLSNTRIFNIMRKVCQIDPSRILLLKSGVPPINQVWMLPYDEKIMLDDGTGYSGWWDMHTVGGPQNYVDSLYKDPNDWTNKSDNKKEIVVWGETMGVGTPDDHEKIVKWYEQRKKTGYDYLDHKRILDGYNEFLDKWGFRKAFPTASDLFQEIGKKNYFFWQKVIENCRMSDPVDYIVVSGWESTNIENHSGIVDALRNFKSNPDIMKKACEPQVLVVRPRKFILAKGDKAIVDVHLINETGLKGKYELTLIAASEKDGRQLFNNSVEVDVIGGDTYGQLLHSSFEFPVDAEGFIKLDAALYRHGDSNSSKLVSTEKILCVDVTGGGAVPSRVLVVEPNDQIKRALHEFFGVEAVSQDSNQPFDAIVVARRSSKVTMDRFTSFYAQGAQDQKLYYQGVDIPEGVDAYTFDNLAPGGCDVELGFRDNWCWEQGRSLLDIALNGQTVIKSLDVFKESGGENHVLVKRIKFNVADGKLVLSIPKKIKNSAVLLDTIKVTDSAGRIQAINCGGDEYTDSTGLVWLAEPNPDSTPIDLSHYLERVKRDGTTLVLWPEDSASAENFAKALDKADILEFEGMIGQNRASWMGSWYFVRQHKLFEGLPTDCVMDWRYQTQWQENNGMLIWSPDMEVAAGYGRDHYHKPGIAACVIPYGRGKIVLFGLPQLVTALYDNQRAMNTVITRRLLGNALRVK
jgi:beta-galactosidase